MDRYWLYHASVLSLGGSPPICLEGLDALRSSNSDGDAYVLMREDVATALLRPEMWLMLTPVAKRNQCCA